MPYTDNPVADYDRHCSEQEKELKNLLERLPSCCECGKKITDDFCYEINDEFVCESCLDKNHRKWVDDCVS